MLSTPEFLEALRRLDLFEAEKVEELHRELSGQNVPPRALADRLVERGLLTEYQAKQVLEGYGDELLLGPYVVLDRLGKGGMGTVYKAYHRKLDRIDAVKVVRDDWLENEEAVKRFDREAQAAAKLRHPNIVMVYDAGEVDDLRYMAMEYIDGSDLGRLVKGSGPLPITRACEHVRQVALGLQHIHERGLVHRDIKPSNLLVQNAAPGESEEASVVKIVDLGLVRFHSQWTGLRPVPMTEFGAMMGTPDFLAPEQATDARSVDIRADLYSLGCTFYYLLTAQVPFPGETLAQKIIGHQIDDPVPVELYRPDVPPEVAAVVGKLMAKKPEDRYQTPAEVAEALGVILRNLPWASSRKVGKDRNRPSGAETPLLKLRRGRSPQSPGNRRWRALGVVALLVVLGTGGYLVWKGPGPGAAGVGPVGPGTGGEVPTTMSPPTSATVPPTSAPPATRPIPVEPERYRNSVGMEFVFIQPGSFDMGSPETEHDRYRDEVRHRVKLTQGFWMQTTLVTQEQWKTVMGQANNPSRFRGADLPVDNVSWNDVQAFCAALRKKEKGDPKYRLPYEAEWEYAARAGTTTPFWQGMTITTEDANFDATQPYRQTDPKGAVRDRTTAVKHFARANRWGLYDMGGNLWQWCEDGYAAYPKSDLTDPKGSENAKERVLRGGSWGDPAKRCRAATRNKTLSGERYSNFGFRVVLPGGAVAPASK
jgi:formylglycine-generating enzyme required for sulfatase activity/tRNA A-37 threonylcarbamoyl transferase component Bud32